MTLDDDRENVKQYTQIIEMALEEYICKDNIKKLEGMVFDVSHDESRRRGVEKHFLDLFLVRRLQLYEKAYEFVTEYPNKKEEMLEIVLRDKRITAQKL